MKSHMVANRTAEASGKKGRRVTRTSGAGLNTEKMLAQIRMLESDILHSTPYDNWSAGDCFCALNRKRKSR